MDGEEETMSAKKTNKTELDELTQQLIQANKFVTSEDVEATLRELSGRLYEACLNGEMDNHLGYEPYQRGVRNGTGNRRNGSYSKQINSCNGDITVDVPRDRDGTFEPRIVAKGSKNHSQLEAAIIKMYAQGTSDSDISEMIREIYDSV